MAPASTWYLAEGAVGGFEAYLAVVNLEPVPVRLALTFYRAEAAPVVQTRDIPAGPRAAAVPGLGSAEELAARQAARRRPFGALVGDIGNMRGIGKAPARTSAVTSW